MCPKQKHRYKKKGAVLKGRTLRTCKAQLSTHSESALSAANSSMLVARSTPSTGSRGQGSQAMETTYERNKPSSAKHRAGQAQQKPRRTVGL
ncbi:hypothetical protein Taro_045560 [Colocasia esculenta]|uniref:Uncharacterized protein n=1 Tax=Colocasia esculenta TaxID=4460 RepID=A0A843X2Z1_COLES|nr:hypothetical protein [Colocasia esculenta]